jgi:hypothetical protein
MWLRYHRLPPGDRHDTHIVLRLDIPFDVTMANCRMAVNYLTRRHEALRTTYHLDPGSDPVQRVHPPAVVPVVRATVERDGTPSPAEVVERLGGTPFDLAAEWPIRACVVTAGEVPKQIVLVLNHMAVDAWTVREIKRELTVQCAAFNSRRPAALEPVRHQPSGLVKYESSAEAAAVAGRALAYWGDELSRLPADPFATRRTTTADAGAGVDAAPEVPARGATLTSPSLLEAGRRVAARHQVWPSLVHLTAYTAMMAAYTGGSTIGHLSFSGNRREGPYSGVMTCMFSPMLVSVDCGDDPVFSELLRRVVKRFELANEHSYVPYDEVVELVSRESSRRGTELRLGSEFNFIKQRSSESRARRTKLTWNPPPSGWAHEDADTYFRIDEWRDAVVVSFHAASAVMDAAAMERFLRGYEATVLAHDDPAADLRLSELTELAGFPAAPEPARPPVPGNPHDRPGTPGPDGGPGIDGTPGFNGARRERHAEAERALADVVREVNGLGGVDPGDSYTLAGGRALRIPRVLSLLDDRGWTGVTVHHLTSGLPLRSLADRLVRAGAPPLPEALPDSQPVPHPTQSPHPTHSPHHTHSLKEFR